MNREYVAAMLKAAEHSVLTLLAVAAGFVVGHVILAVLF